MDNRSTKHRRAVVALGGNALLRRGEPLEAANQARAARDAARTLARVSHTRELVITHGNGPQVGLLALMSDAYMETEPYPLDVLDAETAGQIGYVLEMQLEDEDGRHRGIEAVIDKDLGSSLLAIDLGADTLVLVSDVEAVYDDDLPIARATPEGLRTRQFPAGSMGPKVEHEGRRERAA